MASLSKPEAAVKALGKAAAKTARIFRRFPPAGQPGAGDGVDIVQTEMDLSRMGLIE